MVMVPFLVWGSSSQKIQYFCQNTLLQKSDSSVKINKNNIPKNCCKIFNNWITLKQYQIMLGIGFALTTHQSELNYLFRLRSLKSHLQEERLIVHNSFKETLQNIWKFALSWKCFSWTALKKYSTLKYFELLQQRCMIDFLYKKA